MISSDKNVSIPFRELLSSFKDTLKSVFYEREILEKFVQKRGFPYLVLRDIMANNPLSVAIPKEYGGRGAIVKECLGLLDAASYESLPLSLTMGINIGLFLEPVAKYGQEDAKVEVFNRFLTQHNMGGLMITEPDFGSDALGMQTSNVKNGSNYRIQGVKHWQGLTGLADYWVMTSRAKNEKGDLARDIDFFICDAQDPKQSIVVEEYFNNMGLYPIPYGKNIIDAEVNEKYRLIPETTGLKLMMDLLHRSRLQFSGMGSGFIRRILDEAINHCKTRIVGGKPLLNLDQVQHQIARIQSAFTISSAMCARSSLISGIDNNLSALAVEANSMKAHISDLMQESAQTLTQLFGANGFKAESFGTRGIVDSRPFQIFEGSNEMLYSQISEIIQKSMFRKKISKLSEFISEYDLTQNVADYFKSLLDFSVDLKLPQRKMVDLGKIISRLVSAQQVVDMGSKGFQADLIQNSLESIKHEILMLVAAYKQEAKTSPIENYKENSDWLAYC